MTSFSAHCGSKRASSDSARIASRSSTWAEPAIARSRSRGASSGSTSVKNPTRPTLTPRMGQPTRAATCAACRNVPSPPTDTTRSRRPPGEVPSPPSPIMSTSIPRLRNQAPSDSAARAALGRPGWTTNPTRFTRRPRPVLAPSTIDPSRPPSGPARLLDHSVHVEIRSGSPLHRMKQELHVAGGTLDRRRHHGSGGSPGRDAGLDHALDHPSPDPRLAHHAPAPDLAWVGLELRLHEQDEIGARQGEVGEGGHDEPERDEGQVGHDDLGSEGKVRRREPTRVRPLKDGNSRVVPERPVELSVADVDRDHPSRLPAEQAVGEPSGGRPHVEAVPAGNVDLEPLERRLQLHTAARDEPPGRSREREGLVGPHQP